MARYVLFLAGLLCVLVGAAGCVRFALDLLAGGGSDFSLSYVIDQAAAVLVFLAVGVRRVMAGRTTWRAGIQRPTG